MQLSSVKVEQIDSSSGVIVDYGETLSNNEIIKIASDVFTGTE